ncbi:hypothetical protein PF005_g6918 [Phytophthora fragariae]|uniref:Uncharacterized protein n=1 Tax=Phytophthora fragariae TaxID=53985 RepID=A0A6A3ZXP1_9STRA|nr:hypothetical protein PF003_g20306 [Phytophthora fragariae]KAE8942694.1 hypothetical protein PF009_g7575 [Phytophthora fragariae]KAE9149733.1 hypothetical protein PF006_g5823 [Phytophthora fragariae]KAE9221919.1 hypothetical protein PF005_g6918 [Phytophthora fragariae]KAE9244265.1 hypothetical protein PF002_g7867 [Phytophthora fragariae]
MKSASSRALNSAESFDERLCGVFTLREATPVLNEYLSSIQIDDEDPGFMLSWDYDNLNAFVAAANAQDPARAPGWLQRRRPPQITASSFADDLVHELEQVAGGRCGHILLAPNSVPQFAGVVCTLSALQNGAFMQEVAQVAFGNAERFLATTHCLMETEAHRSRENHLPRTRPDHEPLRRLFI